MKKLFCIVFLFLGFASFGQNSTMVYRFLPSLYSVDLEPISFQINFTTNNLFLKGETLSLYNPNTNSNDNYYGLGKSYIISSSKSFPIYGFEGRRMDSFNPSGTKDFGSAFVFGAITSFLGMF